MASEHRPGEPAPIVRTRRWLPAREEIGPPDCPILHRWELIHFRGRKLMLHHFLPNADDRDVHDHPASFWTLVLRGGYDDLAVCPLCHGDSKPRATGWYCEECFGVGVFLNERMRAGMLRRRQAEHAHRTKVGPRGCWTLVLMGRKERPWGFWRGNRWWPWREYEHRFGFGMRCDREDAPDV